MERRALELLAPAKNRALGTAAVNHGADAVYIGADAFGARAAAGNSVADIEALCAYAHQFNARVYVALNTLIFDNELDRAGKLVRELWNAGADALIVQDMALLKMDLPPIPLFASTQTDNRTPEKVRFLEENGFQRVILARELDLKSIGRIRRATRVDLEAFVHGALCVCYSGQCYMSAAIGGRSANRGACGQPCRLPWNLTNADGKVLAKNRYLLSLKDMDRSDALTDLIRAGVSSFKIEGRLKDMAYVKNVTAHYRRKLDAILEESPEYRRASSGETRFFFTPDPAKTFNRGVTDYFLFGEDRGPVHSFDTPKSMGECLGRVKKATADWLTLEGKKVDINNGDGLCFLDTSGRLRGFQVNRMDEAGRIFPPGRQPVKHLGLKKGDILHRNHNRAFSRMMAGDTADRRIGLDMVFSETRNGFLLRAEDEDGNRADAALEIPKEPAQNEERAFSVIEKQIKKLGSTLFYCRSLRIESAPCFLPVKVLNGLRRQLIDQMMAQRLTGYEKIPALPRPRPYPYPQHPIDFRLNVANRLAEAFYAERGVKAVPPAYEVGEPRGAGAVVTVMNTKHCIRRSLGLCTKADSGNGQQVFPEKEWRGPLFLENNKGRFQVIFNCRNCEMEIRSP